MTGDTGIAQLLEAAIGDEPASSIRPSAVLVAGRRAQRRRRAAAAGSVLGVGAAGTAVAFALLPGASGGTHGLVAGGSSIAPASAESTIASTPESRGITKESLPSQVQKALGIGLSKVDVSVLPPLHDIDLAAGVASGVASAKGQYLNVQVTPAGTSDPKTLPQCRDLEGKGVDGDGYTGQCSVDRTFEGGYLVVRAGRTADEKYAITQADLVMADGFGITAEASNQRFDNKHPGLDPVVSHDPPLTTKQLITLVNSLAMQR